MIHLVWIIAVLGLKVNYLEVYGILKCLKIQFLVYNKYTLYIFKEGSYLDIKNIFSKINGFDTNIGRGGSQKAYIISPLDFRLSCYLMAMFKFDYKYVSYLNAFNVVSKDRYLPYK